MAEKIQRIPAGLLDLLGIVGRGENAAQLNDALVPVIDQLRFYLATRMENVQVTGNVTNDGDALSLDVPSGQFWYVGGAGVSLALTSTLVAAIGVGYRLGPVGNSVFLGYEIDAVGISGSHSLRASHGELSFLLPPGSSIRGRLCNDQAAARSMGLNATIARLSF